MKNHYRNGADALKAMCFGFEPKEIAFFLIEDGIWAGKNIDSAVTRVNACLNPNKPEFFHFSEIIAVSKRTRNFDAVFYACDELGLSRPRTQSIEEQMMRVEDSVMAVSRAVTDIVRSMEHIKQQVTPVTITGNTEIANVLHFSQVSESEPEGVA